MSLVLKDAFQLVDGVLEEGLSFVGEYLQKAIKGHVFITDNTGKIHYPVTSGNLKIDDMFIQLPSHIQENKYYYHKADNSLYYHVGFGSLSAYIIVKNISAEMIHHAICVLNSAELAIKCYFSKIDKVMNKFEMELADYLSLKSDADIGDIIKLSDKNLDIYKPYFASIIEFEEKKSDIDWELVNSYSYEYMQKRKIDVISVCLQDSLTLIIPAYINNNVVDIYPVRYKIDDVFKYKKIVEDRFNMKASLGLGQIYPLLDIQKSYHEARIALTLPKLLGRKNYVQKFGDLGIFTLIFSSNREYIKEYCVETLGKLIDYDKKYGSELVTTLRKLVDNNFNRKAAADSLFIHINTLYYRLTKIEEILGVNMSKIDTKLNIFLAIKVYDTLCMNGLWD